ncbi:MAG: hypothetical protein SOR11_07535 [Fusobacterium sp.]|nr:hypothetical protein [Fusobacterium sp.]
MTPDFLEKAREMVADLKEYKGSKYLNLGDIGNTNKLIRRYNYNGSEGDIYIINSDSILTLLEEVKEYCRYEERSIEYFEDNIDVDKHLDKYHDFKEIKSIIEKYFEIL